MNLDLVNRAAVYIRKSREDVEAERNGEDTLAKQRELLQKNVLPNYVFEYDTFEEVVSGDTIQARPEFQKVLSGLRKGVYQAIVCKDLTRLGRGNYTDMGEVYDLIVERRIFIITTGMAYDPDKHDHRQQIRFNMFFAREEFEMTRYRLLQGKEQAAERGEWVNGKVPFGYEYNRRTRKLQPNEDEAKIVRMIFDLYAIEEKGTKAISTLFKRMGIPAPNGGNEWYPRTVERILASKVHIGYSYFKKTKVLKTEGKKQVKQDEHKQIWVENAHKAIVDAETFYLAQKRLESPRMKPKNNVDFLPCELAGLVDCNECGGRMVRSYTTNSYAQKKTGEIVTYPREYLICKRCKVSIKYREVVNRVVDTLNELCELNTEKMISHLALVQKSRQTVEYKGKEEILADLAKRRAELQKKMDFVINKHVEGTYSDEIALPQLEKIQSELREVEKSIAFNQNSVEEAPEVKTADVEKLKDNLRSAINIYNMLDDERENKNKLLLTLFKSVKLEMVKKGSRKVPDNFNLHAELQYETLLA